MKIKCSRYCSQRSKTGKHLVKSSDIDEANEMKLNIKVADFSLAVQQTGLAIQQTVQHVSVYLWDSYIHGVKHILSRDHILELTEEWNNNLDIGEECSIEEKSNNPATACQQDETSEAQESSTNNNGNIELGAEIETANGGSKSSTPAKQFPAGRSVSPVSNLKQNQDFQEKKGELDKSSVHSTQELGTKSLLHSGSHSEPKRNHRTSINSEQLKSKQLLLVLK
ncbi:uncharacterized protein [Ciconia boyciana]|uniref:uncharacterized protein n=1 Tax=Ciconia boyciana TaxID=52775 RepID=UPI003BA057D6